MHRVLNWPQSPRPMEPARSVARRIGLATAIRMLNDVAGQALDEAGGCKLPQPCDHCLAQVVKAGELSAAILHLRKHAAGGIPNGRR